MQIHDVHDIDAALAAEEILSFGFKHRSPRGEARLQRGDFADR